MIELAKLGHERAAELKASCGAVDVRCVAQLISDLASQLEVQLARGNVQAEQLSNAESKCRELAAESKRLSLFISGSCYVFDGGHEDDMPDEFIDASHYMPIVTPTTDEILAEVRAQSVEMFAERKHREMMSLHPDTHAIGSIAAAMSAELKELREFAAQLRKGAAL
ncbi:hypothetical protein J5Z53_004146 [Citrobacter braakii]|nr:hypothetical protein [Citrobacter braakii]MBU5642271.1 hypothetical protein [Citrobacter sp. S46_ASV_140]